jgi:3-hydroxybutyryl-CoA dehydrogenase
MHRQTNKTNMMKHTGGNKQKLVLITGKDKLLCSLTVCLLQAGHRVMLYTEDGQKSLHTIHTHLDDLDKWSSTVLSREDVSVVEHLDYRSEYSLAIALTAETLPDKRAIIAQLEKGVALDIPIAINTESITLSAIQGGAQNPARIIGANWAEPAHTTLFLEIITSDYNLPELVHGFADFARLFWHKDPYIVRNCGIRARLMGAMIREACFLIENGYASVEDIDRACRNDAGYYLPFAGNFRYMDLMGTSVYGLVMQDLNRELSKDRHTPQFFRKVIEQGGLGMENNRGFYAYHPDEPDKWAETFRQFSYQIQQLISKYPFNYSPEDVPVLNQPFPAP